MVQLRGSAWYSFFLTQHNAASAKPILQALFHCRPDFIPAFGVQLAALCHCLVEFSPAEQHSDRLSTAQTLFHLTHQLLLPGSSVWTAQVSAQVSLDQLDLFSSHHVCLAAAYGAV